MRIPRYVFAFLFIAGLGVMVTAMVLTARGYSQAARTVPLVVGIPTILFIVLQLIRDGIRVVRGDVTVGTTSAEEEDRYAQSAPSEGAEEASTKTATRSSTTEDRSTSMLGAMAWVGLLALLIWLVGMLIAIPVFIAGFMKIFGNEQWRTIAVVAVGTTVAVYLFFVVVLEIRLYTGLFGHLLPWP